MKTMSRDRADERTERHLPSLVASSLLAALVVFLLVVTGVLLKSGWTHDNNEDERDKAQQSARQTAVNLASLDYKNIQKSLDRVLGGLTGEAKDQWATISKDISQTATQAQSTTTVQKVEAGVVSIDGDSAEVIASVTAIATSPKAPQGQPRYQRWRFDLTRTDGKWLVSKLGLVP